jgi:hypothetical protein
MNDIEQAEKTLAGLKQKREALVAHGHSLGEAQGRISYSAHTGDKAARAKLDKLNGEAALHDSELRSLDAAIEEARSRVVAAEYAQEQAADRQKAEEARKVARELGECFPYLDRHLTEAARALIAIDDGFGKLRVLGFGPSDAMVRLNIVAVIQTWAMKLPKHFHNELRDGFRFLAPHERKTAEQYWKAIELSLSNSIRQAAGEPQPPNTASTKEEAA